MPDVTKLVEFNE